MQRNSLLEKLYNEKRKHLDTFKDRFTDCRPPPYSDLGKKAGDLFNTGYYFGVLSLDLTTKSQNNAEITTSWVENLDDGRLDGTVEAKYHLMKNGLTLTEKLNKNCFLNLELSYRNAFPRDLICRFGGAFSPRTGLRMGSAKAEWSNRYLATNADFEIGRKYSLLTTSVVFGYRNILTGFRWKYDAFNRKSADFSFAIGYSNRDFILHTCVNNGNECIGSIYRKVAPGLEFGIDMKWWTKEPEPLYGVAGRYALDRDVAVRGKINNSSELGFSYEQKLSEGITLIMSTFFDLKNVVQGKNKFGLSFHLDL